MANHFVDTGAATVRKRILFPGISKASWRMAMSNGVFIDDLVNFTRRDPLLDVRANMVQNLGVELTCTSHVIPFELVQR